MVGYLGSLRPFSWSSLKGRIQRRLIHRTRALRGARRVPPQPPVRIDDVLEACPTVDSAWTVPQFRSLGVSLQPFAIERDAFFSFLREAQFPSWYYGAKVVPGARFLEKALEHYASSTLLDLHADDVFADIGADNSPFAGIAARLFGCTTYQVDAAYRSGVRGRYVGSDVGSIPLPDGSVTKMAAHCAFDHFQGDADRAFLREAARLLHPGGRLCIIPLYIERDHSNFFDHRSWLTPPVLDQGARLVDVPGWGYEFTRYYSPQSFLDLVETVAQSFSLRIYEITGTDEVDPSCYLRLAAILERQ